MNKLSGFLLTILIFFTTSFSVFAQNNFFTDAGQNVNPKTTGHREIIPEKYRTSTLNIPKLLNFLSSLPSEKNVVNKKQTPIITLPMPNGASAKFYVWESSIMEPGLAAKFPEIKTYAGQGIDDPYASIRFDYNPYFGFHAQILSANGDTYIDPYAKGDINFYSSYYANDNKRNPTFICYTPNSITPSAPNISARTQAACRGTQLYTYRLALACTGEYAIAVCAPNPPTTAATLAAMTTSVNRVDGVYETELAIRMVLIANDNLLIYLNPNTDPYTNNNPNLLLSQNQTNIDAAIGSANYDFGHVFTTGGGGLSALGIVCVTGSKAQSETGLPNPVGDNFDIDYVAHEMGHEFGANHPFNSSAGNCGGGNRNASTAYEVGSGTTIMAYAGICSTDDIQPHSDPFFHSISFDEISNYISGAGGTCAVITNTGNSAPIITAMNNNGANIPLNTPFTLTGAATDPDGDSLTYSWEEWDLGPSTTWNGGATTTTAPIFKFRTPKKTGSRTFPDSSLILANNILSNSDLNGLVMDGNKGETLPTVARTMNFKFIVRDNKVGGGGVTSGGTGGCQSGFNSPFTINAISSTGPFMITSPTGGQSWPGNSSQTVTWNVAGTNVAPINTSNVKISLSTDGGLTFPTVLAASTSNNGSAIVNIPNSPTTTARIKIEAIGNIFFTVSDSNFTISAPTSGFGFSDPLPAVTTCNGPSSDSLTLGTTSVLGFSTAINLTASGNPAGTSVVFGTNPLTPGNSTTVTLTGVNTLSYGTYNVTITGTAGAIVNSRVVSFVVQPGVSPVITIQSSSHFTCVGSNVTFSVAASGATSYQWQLSSDGGNTYNNLSGANSSSYTINNAAISQTGNFYRCAISGQCNTVISNAAMLTVHVLPSVTLSASPVTTLLPGQTTTLTDSPSSSTPGSSTISTTWYQNAAAILNTGNIRVVDVEHIGSYQVNIQETWTDGTICSNQSPVVVINTSVSNRLFIFPSPNNGQFTVSYYNNSNVSTSRTVTVFDSKGAKVYHVVFSVIGPYTLMNIDLRTMQTGIYYVIVGDANGNKLADGKVLIH